MSNIPKLKEFTVEELQEQLKDKKIDKQFLIEYIVKRDKVYNQLIDETNKYNEVLTMLADHYPPCELDDFMNKNVDYCSMNCGVDEEIFKECWDRYIKQRLEDKNES